VGEPAACIKLDDEGPIVEICDEPRKAIILPMNDPVPRGPFGGNPRTEVEGLSEAAGEKSRADLLRLPLDEEAHSDGAV
jgi:hypothetical protein